MQGLKGLDFEKRLRSFLKANLVALSSNARNTGVHQTQTRLSSRLEYRETQRSQSRTRISHFPSLGLELGLV